AMAPDWQIRTGTSPRPRQCLTAARVKEARSRQDSVPVAARRRFRARGRCFPSAAAGGGRQCNGAPRADVLDALTVDVACLGVLSEGVQRAALVGDLLAAVWSFHRAEGPH